MFRLSLRELLTIVAFVAIGIASLKYANDFWLAVVAAVTMLSFFAVTIVAIVDGGPRQAFAIGFALTMLAYGLILLTGRTTLGFGGNSYSKNIEMDPYDGRLPTTRMLRYVHIAVTETQEAVVGSPFSGMAKQVVEKPQREILMPIGHCWWALVLGYAGGRFARWVYGRRIREQQPLATERS
jgi:hypothetical protein